MKKTLLLIWIFLPLSMAAQHFRDNFLGIYNCHVYQTHSSGTSDLGNGSAIVSVSDSDTSYIQIILTDTFYTATRVYRLFPDSTFEGIFLPNIDHGYFYSVDSIYIYANHLSPATDNYYGKRIVINVNEFNINSIELYPIPAYNIFRITEAINVRQVEIYNVAGNLMLTKELKNNDQVEIDVTDFEAGIYFVKCSTYKDSFVKKIVVQH